MIKPKPIIGRVGGKVRLAPWIIEHLKRFQWSIYCEPFAGSAAVYFRLIQEGIFEQIRARGHHPRVVLCDADSRIVQLFKTCRDHPELLAYAVAMTPYSREEHKLAQQSIDGIEDEIEEARRYLVDGWQSFAYIQGDSWGTETGILHPNSHGGKNPYERWQTLPQRILAASPHLQGEPNPVDSRQCLNEVGQAFVEPSIDARVEMARRYLCDHYQSFNHADSVMRKAYGRNFSVWGCNQTDDGRGNKFPQEWNTLPQRILTATEAFKKCYIENDDAVKCIERWATPHTAIYADPPYVDCENYYSHNAKAGKDANLEMHHRLAATLNTVEASAVIVSYYPNELLDELYPEENWERHYKDTVASSAGITRNSKTRTRPKRTELLLVRKSKGDNPVVNLSGQMSLL
jgi:site-specific DNA-adenine methylase